LKLMWSSQLIEAQARIKYFADKNRTERELVVGDFAYLKLQPYKHTSIAVRKCLKLSSRYYGPFQVLEKIGKAAYRLQLPPGSQVHPVFHISQLKRHLGKLHDDRDEIAELTRAPVLPSCT